MNKCNSILIGYFTCGIIHTSCISCVMCKLKYMLDYAGYSYTWHRLKNNLNGYVYIVGMH